MSKQEHILEIDPSHELHFKGPFNKAVNCNIVLRNPTEKRVCFRVKTTAPKKYCVRPNSGIVDPRSKVSVAVMLQPFDFDVKENYKHKFMVRSIIVLENTDNMDNIWRKANPDQIMDSKLNCIFDPADDIIMKDEEFNVELHPGSVNYTDTKEQILQIYPADELHFKGPFNKAVNCNIVLRNPTEKRVCFEVKTTAPTKYCVRPNSGIVEPRGKVSVAVMLQPFDFDVKENYKHKFMLRSIIVLENTDNMDNIWREATPDQIMDSKLNCIFDPADDIIMEDEEFNVELHPGYCKFFKTYFKGKKH